MLDIKLRHEPIANNDRLIVAIAPTCAVLEIRSWLPEHKSGEQALRLNGRELPRCVGEVLSGPLHILCLAPGEWVLVSEEESAVSIAERVATDLASQGAVLVDATDGTGILDVSGALARDVLSKGCGLDLHPQTFWVGRCARTRFAQMPVIVDCVGASPHFRLHVARSYVWFLADWIEDAAVEFNIGAG